MIMTSIRIRIRIIITFIRTGSVTAGVANHIGHGKSAFAKWAQKDIYNKAIAHGLSQGAISQISGGNFKEGFLGGAFSSYAGDSWLDASSSNNVITDTMISSVIGTGPAGVNAVLTETARLVFEVTSKPSASA
jgi:hypothetical protein